MVREPLMSGFPPPAESRVTLANWQDPPYNRWSFQHLRELIPTQRISRGHPPWHSSANRAASSVLEDVTVHRLAGHASTFNEVIAETWTDAACGAAPGSDRVRAVFRRHDRGDPPSVDVDHEIRCRLHRGNLGRTRPARHGQQASTYVPEIVGSGYDGATVRQLLDMRTGSHSARSTPTRTPRSG